MLTNTYPTDGHDPVAITAATIAIEDAERRHRVALRQIARLLTNDTIDALQAAELETDTLARFVREARELERHGPQHCGPQLWARYERRARDGDAQATVERSRSPLPRGLTRRTRVLRERQMAVVASAHVDASLRPLTFGDEDPETIGVRHDLAAAGLL